MNWTLLHLALNHLPVIGVPFLLALLIWGWVFKSRDIQKVALLWSVFLGLAAIGIKFTGDQAAGVEPSRFTALKEGMQRHEESADQATTSVFFWGVAASVSLVFGRGGRSFPTVTLGVVVALGLITSVLFARTAHSGGGMMHPQIRNLSGARQKFSEGEPRHWTNFYARSGSREVHYPWGQRGRQQS